LAATPSRRRRQEMSDPTVVVLEDPDAVARAAAERVAQLARDTVTRRARFAVALSGGSTPRRLYQVLAEAPFRSALPWQDIDVFWGDERCVPPDHPDSNFRMTREALLDHVPIPPDGVHRVAAEMPDPVAAAAAYEAEVARVLGGVPGGPPPAFDLVLLGLGPDGHTASLFPRTTALAERRQWVVANWVPHLAAHRITLTLPVLNRAATLLFLATGADKAAILRAVLEGPLEPERLPAQAVRPESGAPVWLVDRAAAASLSRAFV
jgi:6-phosphogluconolactonase